MPSLFNRILACGKILGHAVRVQYGSTMLAQAPGGTRSLLADLLQTDGARPRQSSGLAIVTSGRNRE